MITVSLDPITTSINPDLCTVNEACIRLFMPPSQLLPCPPNDSLFVSGGIVTDSFMAAEYIGSDGIIQAGNNVVFQSGGSIGLEENFEVEDNATFEANPVPCIPNPFQPGGSVDRNAKAVNPKLIKSRLNLK